MGVKAFAVKTGLSVNILPPDQPFDSIILTAIGTNETTYVHVMAVIPGS